MGISTAILFRSVTGEFFLRTKQQLLFHLQVALSLGCNLRQRQLTQVDYLKKRWTPPLTQRSTGGMPINVLGLEGVMDPEA